MGVNAARVSDEKYSTEALRRMWAKSRPLGQLVDTALLIKAAEKGKNG